MKSLHFFLIAFLSSGAFGLELPSSVKLERLSDLVAEARRNNLEILSSARRAEAAEARVSQAAALDDPQLTYMREEMPGFRWRDAAMQKIELMQMIRFPTKLSRQGELSKIGTMMAREEQWEKTNDIVSRLTSAYGELWLAQQSMVLARENLKIIDQMRGLAQTRYVVGAATQQDVLSMSIELAKMENQVIDLRQREVGAKAMLMALLNRERSDTIGLATLPDSIVFRSPLATVESLALARRPMVLRDSLAVEEGRAMLALARQEYLPDVKVGLQYVTSPREQFKGWSVVAGISLPFAPWTLGKAGARVEEAEVTVGAAEAAHSATRAMVLSAVRDLYSRASAAQQQYDTYRRIILPTARQTLAASLAAYQAGKSDFLRVIDAYRTLVDLSIDALMQRMRFEWARAELERAAGVPGVTEPNQ